MNGTNDDLTGLRERCVGLLFACPEDEPLPDCPFTELRGQDVVARVMWLKRCSLSELNRLYQHHVACLGARHPPPARPGTGGPV